MNVVYLDQYHPYHVDKAGSGSEWIPVKNAPGICDWSCEGKAELETCIIPCFDFPGLYAILPGEELSFSWKLDWWEKGTLPLEGWDAEHCMCFNNQMLPEAKYQLTVDVYREFECVTNDCPIPVQSGYVPDYRVQGKSDAFSIAFFIPLLANTIDIGNHVDPLW